MSVSNQQELTSRWSKILKRRAFLHGIGGIAAAGAAKTMFADTPRLSKGDAAILKFAAAAEFIEADLWQQYNELGGAVDHNDNPSPNADPNHPTPYVKALEALDGDMPQYISDNTDDEISHRDFLNKYLTMHGESPVDFTKFETLPGSTATGSSGKGRLTDLMHLNVDTSWYFRYRSTANPDLGAKFPQLIDIKDRAAIPINNTALSMNDIQSVANIASIHFAFIEQGGSSLYPILAMKATNLEVLRILLSIGGVEIDHFSLWHDKMGNAFSDPLAPLTDSKGLMFKNLNVAANQTNAGLSPTDKAAKSQMFQTNLILPEPCTFLSDDLPPCSIIRPTLSQNGGPMATIMAFTADGLFHNQNPMFLEALMDLASDAEAAQRDM